MKLFSNIFRRRKSFWQKDCFWFELIGWAGSLLILLGFTLLSFGIFSHEDWQVHVVNILGAVLLGVDFWRKQSFSGVFLEIVFGALALVALGRALLFS